MPDEQIPTKPTDTDLVFATDLFLNHFRASHHIPNTHPLMEVEAEAIVAKFRNLIYQAEEL